MFTRSNNTPAVRPIIKGESLFEVQIGKARLDVRPEARHYGFRFDAKETVKVTRCRAVAERVALNMRTDGKAVRLVAR